MIVAAAALVCTCVLLLLPSTADARLVRLGHSSSARRAPARSSLLHRWRRRRGLRSQVAGARDVVQATDLLASLVSSGLDVVTGMSAVSRSLPASSGSTLSSVASALRLGATPGEAWAAAPHSPAWDPVAQAMERSARSGSPLAEVLAEAADDLRREQTRSVQVAARSAGVRAVGPLAACFLPGYLLLGVVPVVASLAGSALRG